MVEVGVVTEVLAVQEAQARLRRSRIMASQVFGSPTMVLVVVLLLLVQALSVTESALMVEKPSYVETAVVLLPHILAAVLVVAVVVAAQGAGAKVTMVQTHQDLLDHLVQAVRLVVQMQVQAEPVEPVEPEVPVELMEMPELVVVRVILVLLGQTEITEVVLPVLVGQQDRAVEPQVDTWLKVLTQLH